MAQAKQENGQSPEHVAAIRVAGFKSIATEQRIEFRPLTVLAGANSSGKSSMMQPLLLLKQTMDATYDPGPLRLDGPHIQFSSVEQLLSRTSPTSCSDRFTIIFESNADWEFKFSFIKNVRKELDVEWTMDDKQRWGGRTGPIRLGMTHDEIVSRLPDSLKEFAENYCEKGGQRPLWEVFRDRANFMGALLKLKVVGGDARKHVPQTFVPPVSPYLYSFLRTLIHVPARRGNPGRMYKAAAVSEKFPGAFDDYVASVIWQWQSPKGPRIRELGEALGALGLTRTVEAKKVDETHFELYVDRHLTRSKDGKRDLINIADVGFGSSSVLPVLVALLVAEPGQVVYVEDPETHLHPRAVHRLAKILADAAKRGVRVVVETHSSLLLVGIQTLIANEELSPDLVKLYWFVRNEQDGATKIEEGEFDENGAYGAWPADFGDVELDADGGYLDAVEARSARA